MRGTVETTPRRRSRHDCGVHGLANFTVGADLDHGPVITTQCSRAIFHSARREEESEIGKMKGPWFLRRCNPESASPLPKNFVRGPVFEL